MLKRASSLKILAKDTAIYGISSIVARFINYLLVPIQTARFTADGGQYGIITNVYAYTALLIIILTYGMETTLFRFMNKDGINRNMAFSTSLRMLGVTSFLFSLLVIIFRHPLATILGYKDHPEYIWVLFVTVSIDAFSALLFAYLRLECKAMKFALLKIINILTNVFLNILYLLILPAIHLNLFNIYDSEFHLDVAWVFYINAFCTFVTLLMLYKEMRGISYGFDKRLCLNMLKYSWPIFIMGVVGQLNQSASQILFPYLFSGPITEATIQLGIYGASIKIAMIMVIITQAFRFAYEPFVFGLYGKGQGTDITSIVMKYYVIFTLLAFLVVIGYINIIKFIIDESYWSGLYIVPIVMTAEIMFGIYFNLSFWYKLLDKTIYGAIFSFIGSIVLITIDVIFIPRFGYIACAWAGFFAYFVSMILSYCFGQRYKPVHYPLRDIFLYVFIAIVMSMAIFVSNNKLTITHSLCANTALIIIYIALILYRDIPIKSLPIIGKLFKKR